MEAGVQLPDGYVQFLRLANGGEGFMGEAYAILWRVEELRKMNQAYQVEEYAPGLLLIGSNGGGEAYAFDLRSAMKPLVRVPFVGMALDLVLPVDPDFIALLNSVSEAHDQGSAFNNKDAKQPSVPTRNEIFDITPIILGGSPTDLANKTRLDRRQHIEAVRYWNKLIRDLRQTV